MVNKLKSVYCKVINVGNSQTNSEKNASVVGENVLKAAFPQITGFIIKDDSIHFAFFVISRQFSFYFFAIMENKGYLCGHGAREGGVGYKQLRSSSAVTP